MTESFDEFAARELPSLLRFAAALTGDRELARDVVQDVMLKAHSRWQQVSAADHPRAYVRTMITNAHLSWRRRWSVRHIRLVDHHSVEPTDSGDETAAVDDRAQMRQILNALPRQQRAVLVLRFYEDLGDDEIAVALGCTVGTVRGYISRALATLRSATHLGNCQEIR